MSSEINEKQTQGPTTPQIREESIRRFWKERGIFEESISKQAPKGNYVFFDGPPYATGLPHYGHMLPSTIKDIIPRYKTMQGYKVLRKWGWDCHGLPIENLIEKELGLKDKKAIEEYGIKNFNKAAKESVFRYDRDWQRIVEKLGRWVDMENGYHTMDSSYTESVWWSFSELNKKGLVYEAYKVMPFCPRCQTTLSNFEVGQGYKDIPDISAYVLFESSLSGEHFLAWTTTPWTLPGNSALAVSEELQYVLVDTGVTKVWVAEDLVAKLSEKKILPENISVVKRVQGKDLVGVSYTPPFGTYTKKDTLASEEETKRENGWKVYAGSFVTAEDGTGIVHIAPAFGGDDMDLAHKNNIPVIVHVDSSGKIKDGIDGLSGLFAKPKENHQATDIEVIKYLAHTSTASGQPLLFAKEKITHSYPHCWRCETPLLNYATSSWFVRVTTLQESLIAENKKINWVPKEVGENRFGEWLANVRDWNVSRSRYWGAPLPVWKNKITGEIVCIGSVSELKSKLKKRNEFTLMRHGECETNVKNIINSTEKDLELYGLTAKGRTEALESALKLKASGKKITKIYASDFRRTRETAEIVAEVFGIDPKTIVFDKRAREIHGGDFDGGNWSERALYFKSIHDKIYKKVPNGESVVDVKRRITELLYDLDAQNENESILLLTHGLPLRLAVDASNGKTCRDYLRSSWRDVSDPTASTHDVDFRALPHDDDFELDLHRPYIDQITWENEKGEVYQRVQEVFDVWYDSGAMPFAQNHYPFENTNSFDVSGSELFPADFIAEGLDQTRGWFYSLLVLGVALFGKSPYKNVTVSGLILAEDGRKMSKSLKNYPDLEPTLDTYGADALRYMLAGSPATHAEEVLFSEKALDEVNKKIFNRLENVFSFYDMYTTLGEVHGVVYPSSTHALDVWILNRLAETKVSIEKGLDSFVIDKATRSIGDFVDDLSTWYLRRSRDRFKSDAVDDRRMAIETTQFVLTTTAKIIAPITPFFAEYLYLRVKDTSVDTAESVHLSGWPMLPVVDSNIIESMAKTRKVIEIGLAERSKSGIKARQPLESFTYPSSEYNLSSELEEIVKDELNVKRIVKGNTMVLDTVVTEELKTEGVLRDILRSIQEQRKELNLNPQDDISLTVKSTDIQYAEKILSGYTDLSKKASVASMKFEQVLSEGDLLATHKFKFPNNTLLSCHITSTKQGHI